MVSGEGCGGGLCAKSPAAMIATVTRTLNIGAWHFPPKGAWHLLGHGASHLLRFLPAEPDSQTRLAFAVRARHFCKPVQIANSAVWVELQVRDVAARVIEMRGVEQVEHLEP